MRIWRYAILGCICCWVLFAFAIHKALSAGLLVAPTVELPAPPKASFGVIQCGKPVVIWIILANNHVVRFDKEHKPDDVQKLLEWLDTGPADVYVLPCPTTT